MPKAEREEGWTENRPSGEYFILIAHSQLVPLVGKVSLSFGYSPRRGPWSMVQFVQTIQGTTIDSWIFAVTAHAVIDTPICWQKGHIKE